MTAPATNDGWLAWRQLVRAGNAFTAASNVLAGFLVARGAWPGIAWGLACLVLASVLLYSAGMVLNDAFDATVDAVERPERPIPSGRIGRGAAWAVGWLLLAGGVGLAVVVSAFAANPAPAVVACCLAVMVVMYDGGLKSTWAGPWAMGWCRALNVLLGASGGGDLSAASSGWAWAYAGCVGLYTVALTYIARGEMAGDAAANARKRRRVKQMILGFVVIDAIAATVAAGWLGGLVVVSLLIPALAASRRAPMT